LAVPDVTDEQLVDSQQQEIDLIGPTTPKSCWQAKAGGGFASSRFVIDILAEGYAAY